MSIADTTEASILDLIFKNIDFANIGDAGGLRGSVTAGSLYWALHTADPGDAGSAVTSEAAYTGYARVAGARGAGFVRTGNSISPAAAVSFPAPTAGTGTVTHQSIVNTASGAGVILWSGTVAPNITVTAGVPPVLSTASTITLD